MGYIKKKKDWQKKVSQMPRRKYLVFYGSVDDIEDGINEIFEYGYVVHSQSVAALNALIVIMEYVGDESTEVS
ncbi:MAG: hypothetical protein OXN17_17260 [Candidatus Poribacteria bacterium]|nr:hypothetical protein [Candidatus Poribacteria bacterium]MDE0505808.1 hypothetical protein [Candidatus Poribacteria bacterium]